METIQYSYQEIMPLLMRAAGWETKLLTTKGQESSVTFASDYCPPCPSFHGSLCLEIRVQTTVMANCKCHTAALYFLAAQILIPPTGSEAAGCRCYTTQWNSCYTYCNLIVGCLLLEQHTQLEALFLGGSGHSPDWITSPHTLCGMCDVSSDRNWRFFVKKSLTGWKEPSRY